MDNGDNNITYNETDDTNEFTATINDNDNVCDDDCNTCFTTNNNYNSHSHSIDNNI